MRLCNRAAGNLKIHEEKLLLASWKEAHLKLRVRAHNDPSNYSVNNNVSMCCIKKKRYIYIYLEEGVRFARATYTGRSISAEKIEASSI